MANVFKHVFKIEKSICTSHSFESIFLVAGVSIKSPTEKPIATKFCSYRVWSLLHLFVTSCGRLAVILRSADKIYIFTMYILAKIADQ